MQCQDTGRFLVVDAEILDQWKYVRCSPFSAVEKRDVPLIEIRLIHKLPFPAGASTNDLLDKTCSSEVHYVYVMVLAAWINFLATTHPKCTMRILKDDVKGAYRHLMTSADHVHQIAGLVKELNALGMDFAASFDWSGLPQFYSAFGRPISCLVAINSPATVSDSSDLESDSMMHSSTHSYPKNGWVDGHIMIAIDVGGRLHVAEATTRHPMLAILGPRSIYEAKFHREKPTHGTRTDVGLQRTSAVDSVV